MKGSKGALAPGIQKPSDDWAAVVVGCVDEYVFVAEIGAAEALEPRSLAEAKSRPDWLLWEKVAEDKMKSLRDAETWEVVEMPKDVNVIGSKWVFKAKKNAAGAVVQYKARLVTQGFLQVPGVDYFDTFAPVTHLASIRTVLTFIAAENYETGQIDIKSAYLNRELTDDEVIYMKQTHGYCQNSRWSELRSRYRGHVIKTWLQLVCCTLVWELGCLVISGSRKEGVSGMEYRRTEKLSWGAEGLQRI